MEMTAPPPSSTRTASLEAVFADDAAFRTWYDEALPQVFRYLYHRCGRDRDLAEELTQQAFVEAVRSHATFAGGESVAWLIGIARHRLVDHFRVLERRERSLRRLLAERTQPVWIGAPEVDDELATALDRLPAAQRAAIVLRYLDDLPVRDVARWLDRSEGAVESLLSRGREALRRIYREGVS
jgi:RNA polymerase sigma-70 factor, ECF subfamily